MCLLSFDLFSFVQLFFPSSLSFVFFFFFFFALCKYFVLPFISFAKRLLKSLLSPCFCSSNIFESAHNNNDNLYFRFLLLRTRCFSFPTSLSCVNIFTLVSSEISKSKFLHAQIHNNFFVFIIKFSAHFIVGVVIWCCYTVCVRYECCLSSLSSSIVSPILSLYFCQTNTTRDRSRIIHYSIYFNARVFYLPRKKTSLELV